jgi:hypothetical protein
MESLGAFTNVRGEVGKPSEPGGPVYQDINTITGGTPGEQLQLEPGKSINLSEYGITPPEMPPGYEQYMNRQYADRDRFERHVFEQIGGNPFMLDPWEEVQKADKELPKIFEQVFQGHAAWEARAHLDPQQKKFWNQVVNQYHAYVKSGVMARKKQMMDEYNWMMQNFDNAWKQAQANVTKYQNKVKALVTRLAPKKKTGKAAGGAKPLTSAQRVSAENTLAALEMKLKKIYDEEGKIPPNLLRRDNDIRKVLGLRPLIEQKTPGKEAPKVLGVPVWFGKEDKYTYKRAEPGQTVTRTDIVEIRKTKDGRLLARLKSGAIVELEKAR